MNPFPVFDSRLSASHLGVYLQNHYQLSTPLSCRILKTGISHSYLIDDGASQYVFRLYFLNWRTPKEIEEEIRLLKLLKENAVPISYPVADASGAYLQEILAPEGLRYGVLFSFAEGEKVRFFSAENSYKIGTAMAHFHQITEGFYLERITYNADTLLTQPLQVIKKFFAPDSETMLFVEKTTHALVAELKTAKTDQLRHGAVHLDIWFDNMHIAPNGKVTLFDFDFCGNGWQSLDLAYFNVQLFHTEPDPSAYQEKLRAFFEGYESIVKIKEEEKRLIPALAVSIWFFYLSVQCQRYDDWGNLFISEDYFKRFIGMIQKWCGHHLLFNNNNPT